MISKTTILPNSRNSGITTIILIGLNTALRINDILHITWGDVYCGERRRFYTHLLITEKKTGKETRILINKELQETLLSYRTTQPSIADTDYLFPSPRKTGSPLSRYQAYRIVRKAAEAVGIEDVIRCHSLRKTSATMHGKWELRPHC